MMLFIGQGRENTKVYLKENPNVTHNRKMLYLVH